MNIFIMLILGLFFTNHESKSDSEKGYYTYSVSHQSHLQRCTVSPCPDPKDY